MSSEKKSKEYPRALPHRAPDKAATSPDRSPDDTVNAPVQPRMRSFLLLGMVCLLVLAGAGTAPWWSKISIPSDVEISANPQPDSPLPEPISPSLNPSAGLAVAQSKKESDLPGASTKKPSTETVAVSKNSNDAKKTTTELPVSPVPKERYLEALGSLTAAHLYQSFLNIGLLADAVENEQMESAEGDKTLTNIIRMMTLVEGQLDQIAKTGLDPNDRKSLQDIRKLTETLQTQATALRNYWATGNQDQAATYHAARTKAWTGISEMLGLENTDAETASEEKKAEKR